MILRKLHCEKKGEEKAKKEVNRKKKAIDKNSAYTVSSL